MKLTIEIDGKNNEAWAAPFLQRLLRGRFDFMRVKEPLAPVEAVKIPAVPGQRLTIDPERRVGAILEPLQDAEHAGLCKQLAQRLSPGGSGATLGLEPAAQEFQLNDPRDVPTWLFWMRRAVQSGVARVVEGQLPEDGQCAGAKKLFFSPEPREDEGLALRKQELAARLATMTPQQREEYRRLTKEMG